MNVPTNPVLFDAEFMQKIERLELLARKVFRGLVHGEHTTHRRGYGLEFSDYRRYQPGDDLRYIDWNLYSRLDQLFLKLYASDEDMSLHVVLDCSASMGYGDPQKFDYARKLTAALGYIGLGNLDRVGVCAFSSSANVVLPTLKSKRQMARLLPFLGKLTCAGSTGFVARMRDFSKNTRSPGVVVVITDILGDEELFEGLTALSQGKHDVVLLHLLAEDEITPPLDGPLNLIDAESLGSLRVTVDAGLRQLYIGQLQLYLDKLEQFCRQSGVEYLRASTSIPFEDLVLTYLRSGKHWR